MAILASDPAASDRAAREQALLAAVDALVRELHPQRGRISEVTLESRIERDLGIDSLGRTELALRIERAFRARLPIKLVAEAETVGDLLAAVDQSAPQARVERAPAPPTALPLVPPASQARTLVEVLDWHAARHGERRHLTLLQDDVVELGHLTYAQLAQQARQVAAGLIARDIVPGDRIALMLPTSIDFFVGLFGILYAGAVPVPIYPPMRLSQLEDHMRRQAGILRNAGARILITVAEGRRLAVVLRMQVATLDSVETVADLATARADIALPPVDAQAIGLIQYTSGSTGDPKGVVLSHANLLANIRAMGSVIEAGSADVFMSWLPLYHDMGLIGAWFGSLYYAAAFHVMSPLSFLVRPESWLWAIHRTRATLSAAPNFAYELCLNKIDEKDIEGLDLGSLRMVANGAEPVSARTMRRFIERFGRYGFRPSAMTPVYGLAENAVGLAFPPHAREPVVDRIDRDALGRRGVAMPAKPGDPHALEIVACGQPLPGHEIRILDRLGHEVGEREEGRLEFRGPSSTAGYFRNEAKTRDLIHDGWLDSADRAYMAGGDIYITGRIKDIVIRAGRNLYPQEIEEAIADIPGIRKGCVAVFGASDPASGTERLIVLAETREGEPQARARLQQQAYDVATDMIGTPPDEIVLVPPRTVPKTSSGKIRRSAAKDIYLSGRLGPDRRAMWSQMARLALAGAAPQMRRSADAIGALLYAAWWWSVLGVGAAMAWSAVMGLPRLAWRWAALRMVARMALRAFGVPLTTRGLAGIPAGNAMLVFNHASYIDSLVLAAVLPGMPVFVAKREFEGQFFAGPLLRRLGVLFVERYDVAGSLADAQAVAAAARAGRLLVFFPEGTFTRRTGLSAFYLGAFKVAAEAGLPILPGAIRGTRSMLRSDQWFPRWAPIAVEIGEPISPSGSDFASVLKLRDRVRAAILLRCGEPDLGELVKPPAPANARAPASE